MGGSSMRRRRPAPHSGTRAAGRVGTWFPLIDRNPESFVNIPDADAGDFKPATQRVVRSRTQPSGVVVNVLSLP